MNAAYEQAFDSRALGVAAALHVVMVVAAFSVKAAPEVVGMPPSLLVSLHAVDQVTKEAVPEFVPPPPRHVSAPPVRQPPPPVLAAPEVAPAPRTVAVEPEKPEPVQKPVVQEPMPDPVKPVVADPVPASVPVASEPMHALASSVVSSMPAPKPVAVVPPRFDADYLHNPAPIYPHMSRRLREQGRVLLRVMVTADGLPSQIEIRESSGFPRLDQAAQESVQRWRFVPARQGDRGVSAWVLVPISYSIRS